MTALQQIKQLLPTMSIGEKAQLIQWVASDIEGVVLGIEKTPGICGGDARIARTRIPVWLLVRQRQLNISEEEILEGYPSLRAEDLNNAWDYYAAHREEIETQIRENEAE